MALIFPGNAQEKKCKGHLRTDSGRITLVPTNMDHNCEGDEKKTNFESKSNARYR